MKLHRFLERLALLASIPLFLWGCEEDPNASSGSAFQFAGISSSYYEADGDATITIPFRNASGSVSVENLVIESSATAGEDFEIVSVSKSGIEIALMDDTKAEDIETIRILLPGSGGNSVHTVRLLSDDPGFLSVRLNWTDPVDLDLISWYFDPADEEWHDLDFSDPGNTLDPIDWKDPDGLYGFTYNYYAGSDDSVPFSVVFTPTGVTLEGATGPLTFNATYTLANVDPNNVQIEQMVTKTGTAFTDFSDIEVPETGSRKAELRFKLRLAAARLAKAKSK